jgi:hypothetical protein
MRPPSTYAFRVGIERAGRDRRFALRGSRAPRAPWADALASLRDGRATLPAPRSASSRSPRASSADDGGAE